MFESSQVSSVLLLVQDKIFIFFLFILKLCPYFRTHDYENFVCTLLLRNTARLNAFAVRSFNVEIAKVAEQVSQHNIALMRFTFWEETLDKCFTKDINEVPKHPVAMEVYRVNNYLNSCVFVNRVLFALIDVFYTWFTIFTMILDLFYAFFSTKQTYSLAE